MRQEYTMEQADMDNLIEACQPVRMIALQCGTPRSPQQNANDAWNSLGAKMGFDGSTVQPSGSNQLKFTAVPLVPTGGDNDNR